jgi:hypothetical protein
MDAVAAHPLLLTIDSAWRKGNILARRFPAVCTHLRVRGRENLHIFGRDGDLIGANEGKRQGPQ